MIIRSLKLILLKLIKVLTDIYKNIEMQSTKKVISLKLVRNEIPKYVTFLAKYLSTPLSINENKYVTEEELRANNEKTYRWSKIPHINCRLPSYEERMGGTLFTTPKYYKNSEKEC